LTISELWSIFAGDMYFKSSIRQNPATGEIDSYYRLVESYRNEADRVCHRTLLNAGFLKDSINVEELNQVRRILCKRYQDIKGGDELFDIGDNNPQKVIDLANKLWNELVEKNRIDIGQKEKKTPTVRQRNMVFEESIRHPDVREIGGEWLCHQALNQLKLADYLSNIGFTEEETQLAITQIIARAVYPASELETARWIRENSGVCQISGYPVEKITKDKLYKSSLKLFSQKEKIESFLSVKTNQLFDIEDKIYLYDLTNTYFEGRKLGSTIAKFGRSKEKRSDCKIVVLAFVINPAGFIKYSDIYEGLSAIAASLEKKSGVKIEEKVYERVGRLKQKYPSIARYYEISYTVETEKVTNRKTKKKEEIRKVASMTWKIKQGMEPDGESGIYFLRTSLPMSEELTWMIYNIIREIESSFRTLKTDLDLRPVYHKKDDATMAHLNLGLLAYWVVNTVRYQLKKTENETDTEPVNFQWKEIIRIMNTRKSVMTVSENRYEEVIISRRCSEPTPKVEAIYRRLKYRLQPFTTRKFVVHKAEFEKMDVFDLQTFAT
jgi:hypothetical protein